MNLEDLSTATYCRMRSLIDAMPDERATLMYLRLGGERDPDRLARAAGLERSIAERELACAEAEIRSALFDSAPFDSAAFDSAAGTGAGRFPGGASEQAIVALYREAGAMLAPEGAKGWRGRGLGAISEIDASFFLLVAAACVIASLQPLLALFVGFY